MLGHTATPWQHVSLPMGQAQHRTGRTLLVPVSLVGDLATGALKLDVCPARGQVIDALVHVSPVGYGKHLRTHAACEQLYSM